ncbi:MAG: OB-fold nucleic acid binding domain-containing protein, partial [Clostridia bacterium]|nr:OB-fold nucleic acid binding domain-containing protein [Clostridia bacterium]
WDEGVVTTPATCTTEGVMTFTCTVDGCGETHTETIAKSAHNFVDNVCEDCQATVSYVDKAIVFTFGANGNAEHKDGSPDKATYTETKDGYTLSISGGSKMYPGSFDAKGNSALKLGTGSVAGSFEFTVPADVTEVIIYVAQYKANTTKISVNSVAYTITTKSNDGAYTEIKVDTTVNKKVSFTTVSGGYRCMINTIEFKVSAENICNHENREVDEVVAPTCTVAGHTTYVCPDCGHTFDADFVDAKGHTLVSIPAVAPTCENTGLTEGEKCSVCGHVTIEQTIVDMLPCVDGDNDEYCDNCGNAMCEHTYGDWTFVDEDAHKHVCSKCGKEEVAGHNYEVIAHVDATCEEAGSTEYACADCGHEYTETHVALGHNETPHDAKAPTCSAVGWEAYVTCSRCDYTTYDELPIDADAHKWDEGEVQTPATCTEAGERLHTCEHNAEHTKVEVIPATGHTPVKNVCACGYEYSVDEIIAMAEALAKDTALKGTYRLTGVITSVDTEFSTQYNNVTVTITVDGTEKDLTIKCFRMKGEGADKIGVGDTITVSGAIKRYGTTLEFDEGCALESYIPAAFEVYLEVFGKGTVSGIPAGTLARGDEVTFTVTPDTANEYEIDRVTINGSTLNGTDGVYKFTVSANTTINVSFKKSGQESSTTNASVSTVIGDYATANGWKDATRYDT